LIEKLYAGINEDNFSAAEQIAAVVYEAATDGRDKLRYVAGEMRRRSIHNGCR